ncbi:MAG: hypothetical protein ACREDR_24715, partial [Blastocatellia bacterium]
MNKRRLYQALAVVAVTTITVLVVAQTRKRTPAGSTTGSRQGTRTTGRRAATTTPIRAADPNLAPQVAVDDALYVDQEFFGSTASVARPYADALTRVSDLVQKYPKDARLRLTEAKLSERLGQFDKSASEMVQYADFKKRSPDSLRRLVDFYRHREMPVDEVKTLRQLAASVTVDQRGPIYK